MAILLISSIIVGAKIKGNFAERAVVGLVCGLILWVAVGGFIHRFLPKEYVSSETVENITVSPETKMYADISADGTAYFTKDGSDVNAHVWTGAVAYRETATDEPFAKVYKSQYKYGWEDWIGFSLIFKIRNAEKIVFCIPYNK